MCLILSPPDFNLFTLVLNFKHVPKCLAGRGPRQIVDVGADSRKVDSLVERSPVGQWMLQRVWDDGRGRCCVAQLRQVIRRRVPRSWGCARLTGSILMGWSLDGHLHFSVSPFHSSEGISLTGSLMCTANTVLEKKWIFFLLLK